MSVTSLMDGIGDRQHALMKLLLSNKQGLATTKIAGALGITGAAVRQHLWILERSGYVERGELVATGGRPRQVFRLTARGYDLFPKQYSWFSEVLIETIEKEEGKEGLKKFLKRMGKAVSQSLQPRMEGKTRKECIRETVKIMNELAYEAVEVQSKKSELPVIEATNCVYHQLARKHPEICQFDLVLLENLTGRKVTHEKCIIRRDNKCRFSF